jgi:queuine tRNA-ribosyltransferase
LSQTTFDLLSNEQGPRLGVLHTAHGDVSTPALCVLDPWDLTPSEMRSAGASVVGISDFALQLRATHPLIAREGGIHAFLRWQGPLILDAGSGTIFREEGARETPTSSLSADADGVTVASPIDGTRHHLTPESAMSAMLALGADLIVPLRPPAGPLKKRSPFSDPFAMAIDWAERSRGAGRDAALMFGIPPGLATEDSTRLISGLSAMEPVGYSFAASASSVTPMDTLRFRALSTSIDRIPIGFPDDVDIVGWRPRVGAEAGHALTPSGLMNLTDPIHTSNLGHLDDKCPCPACERSVAYLHHLFMARELLGPRLVSLHNLTQICRWVDQARTAGPA